MRRYGVHVDYPDHASDIISKETAIETLMDLVAVWEAKNPDIKIASSKIREFRLPVYGWNEDAEKTTDEVVGWLNRYEWEGNEDGTD